MHDRTTNDFLYLYAGSDVVLLFASKYSDIKTIVNLSEHYDMKAGIGEPFGKDYLERIRKDGFIDVKKRRSGNLSFTQCYSLVNVVRHMF